MLLVTHAHSTIVAAPPNVGRLIQPRHYSSIEETARSGRKWACDNDAFVNFDSHRFRLMLQRITGLDGCLFVAAPDVVGDAPATSDRFDLWHDEIAETGCPIALVAQDGLEEPPWPRFDALVIGGAAWAGSPAQERLLP